ncbi:DNA-directed RNA polymerase subunit alpha [Candidatus Microgenomates bacterium]|nr:DNA-directed RNA polymerase subunit alpha [Candidatus Microgenomates bacterium]
MIGPNFKVHAKEERDDYGRFIIEPLDLGFGQTLGNTLRRILLSALPGAAVTTVKINGVKHQFSTLSGLKEDTIELILNIKKLRVRLFDEGGAKLTLSKTGPGEVTAADFEKNASIEIVNKDLKLGNLADKKSRLELEATVEKGYGYSLAEERKSSSIGVIPIDAIFTPVTRVNYQVEETRVGRMTNLDKLILEIYTDGTISPKFALEEAAKTLVSYTLQIYEPKASVADSGVAISPNVSDDILKMTVDELDLPTRVYNSLKNGGIDTIGQLLGTPRKELTSLKNVGEKSLSIIDEKLREKGVALTV